MKNELVLQRTFDDDGYNYSYDCSRLLKNKKKSSGFNKFLKQNPEVIFRLMLLVCAVLVFVTWAVTKRNTEAELKAEFKTELTAERIRTEQETIKRIKDEYGITDAKIAQDAREDKAHIIGDALVPYEEAGNTDEALYMIAFSMLNRQASTLYSDDIYKVVTQEAQYMGKYEKGSATDRCYRIALDACTIFDTTGAPMGRKFVYVNWTAREVKLLDNLESGQSTHTYYETDMRDYLRNRG